MRSLDRLARIGTTLISLCMGVAAFSQAQMVTTVAGGFVGDGRAATKASFQLPYGLIRDKSGNTYICDTYGHRVRKIATTGIISTYAGTGVAGFSGDGGPAASAIVSYPIGLSLDPAGEVVFTDWGNNRIRKIDLSGNISTIAGNGTAGYTGDGGPATAASLNGPKGVAYDSAGNLYISDTGNNVIRKVNTSGNISTYVAVGVLKAPSGLATDGKGNLYIADQSHFEVKKVDSLGNVTIVAGNGTGTLSGDGGPAIDAGIGVPRNLSLKNGILYISTNADSRVRAVTLSTGIIETFIGSTTGYDGDGHSPSATELDGPFGLVSLSSSSMLVVDRFNGRLRELSAGVVKTVAGGYIGDGNPATSAAFLFPEEMAFDSAGDYFVPDNFGHRIRKVDTTGKIATVAGTGVTGYSGDGGPATSAELSFPQAVAVDSANNIFVIDQSYTLIRRIDGRTGIITTFSTNTNFTLLKGLAVAPSGTLYAADYGTCVVWKIDSAGSATVAAGIPFTCGYNSDHILATSAWLNSPTGLAFDSLANLYIADYFNNRIRKVNTSGVITTFAGDGTACALSTDPCGDGGSPIAAQLNFPIAVASAGSTLYIADEFDLRIRKVAGGIITTYAGTGLAGYNGNGLPALSTNLDDPVSVAVNPVSKILYLVDDAQMRVRKVH